MSRALTALNGIENSIRYYRTAKLIKENGNAKRKMKKTGSHKKQEPERVG